MIGIAERKLRRVIALGQEIETAEAEFEAYVEGLTEEEQAALVALMWVGRGDFDADDWEDALNTALTDAPGETVEVLTADEDFPDHLETGWEEMDPDEDEDDEEEPPDMGEEEEEE